MALLAIVVALCACRTRVMNTAVASMRQTVKMPDSLTTDSIAFLQMQDSTLSCRLVVDYPAGQDSLAGFVRQYISETLAGLQYNQVDQGPQPTDKVRFKGGLQNGKPVVDFYGKNNFEQLRREYTELSSDRISGDIRMSYDLRMKKTEETDKYITYTSLVYVYLAGAHGSTILKTQNIVKSSGRVLDMAVDTLRMAELQPLLRAGVMDYLNRNLGEGEKVTSKNLNDYLFIENGVIPMPAFSPTLTSKGVRFVYQQYEIGPYALGIVDFTVPYADIRSLLTYEARQLVD